MSYLSAGDQTLHRGAEMVTGAQADLTHLQAALSSQISALQGRWAGQGAMAFHQLHQAWMQRQSAITRALTDFESALRATDRDNKQTDMAQADAMAHLTRRIG